MKQITKTEKWTYTGSLLGQNMIYSFVAMYVMFFFTDLLRIPPQSVTVIMVTASLWDAVNDILMGMIADRTKTRWGKFRPYLLAGPFFTVSYTHLDVYKRQVLHVPVAGHKLGQVTVARGGDQAEAVEQVKLHAVGAVSYTHLDVYKRQGL